MGDCNCDPRTHGKRFYKGGACYNLVNDEQKFDKCVLFGNECTERQSFSRHQEQCEPSNMSLGRCLKEDTCAARASDCAEDTSRFNFAEQDGACTIQRDKTKTWDTNNPQFTRFGSCYNANTDTFFCIYDPTQCDESEQETYLTPAQTLAQRGTPCDCSEVHVTACVGCSGRSHCVLRPEDCNEDDCVDPVRTPHFQRMERDSGEDGLDCRLCLRTNTPEPTRSPTVSLSPTGAPTVSSPPTQSPTQIQIPATFSPTVSPSMSPDESGGSSTVASTSNNKGMIVGASLGGAAALLLTVGLIYYFFKRMKIKKEEEARQRRRRRRKKEASLPSEISIS